MISITLSEIKDSATIIAAGVASYVAIAGLTAWKKQLKGKTEYEQARRYLRAAFKVRDAMSYVRNPLIPVEEMNAARKEEGLAPLEGMGNMETNRFVYIRRWKKLVEANSDLDVELLEAEVSWGKIAIEAQKPLNDAVTELFVTLKMFINGFTGQTEHTDAIIYETPTDKVFTDKINKAVGQIEDFLKPHLK